MSLLISPIQLTPTDVERASERDARHYELVDGELKEKIVGTRASFVATQIGARLNAALYPRIGFAATEVMVYCFTKPNHGRKPDVAYVRFERMNHRSIPEGDLHLAPDLAVEVLSPGNTGLEVEEKLNEYLESGVAMVWIVNPDRRTIRIYWNNDRTKLFHANDVIENEPLLRGFVLKVGEVFPEERPAV
jgi:Uma2 family endonuclease